MTLECSAASSQDCPTSPAVEPPLPRWLWAVAGGGGLGLLALGLALIALPVLFPRFFATGAVVSAGYGLIGVTLGAGLVVGGVRGWRQSPPLRFYGRRSWWVFLTASLIVAGLALALPDDVHTSPLFAPFHFALILLPGLFLFSLLAWLSGPASAVPARRLTLAAAGGAGTIVLAIPLELVGLFVSAILAVAVLALLPGGAAEVERLMALLQGWSVQPPTDEMEILSVLASPAILGVLALLLGVITPLVEEFGKTLVLGLMGIWVKPTIPVSFLWGAACGLGFAWLEGISNGAMGLGESVGWLGGVGVRFFATAMHVLTSGIVGIGWALLWRRKWWALPLAYGVAVLFHGLWNLNVVFSLGGMGTTVSSPLLGGTLTLLGVAVQISLIGMALVALAVIPLVLRRREEAAVTRPS